MIMVTAIITPPNLTGTLCTFPSGVAVFPSATMIVIFVWAWISQSSFFKRSWLMMHTPAPVSMMTLTTLSSIWHVEYADVCLLGCSSSSLSSDDDCHSGFVTLISTTSKPGFVLLSPSRTCCFTVADSWVSSPHLIGTGVSLSASQALNVYFFVFLN